MGESLFYVLQWVIFGMGVAAVTLSFYFIKFFSKAGKHRSLSLAMQLFLLEQVVSAAGVLIFSVSSLSSTLAGVEPELWNTTHPLMAIAIRAAMFSAMLTSTTKLSIEIKKLTTESDGEP